MSIFYLLYALALKCLIFISKISIAFSSKAKSFYHKRKVANLPTANRPYWIHCASVGEYEMIVPLLELLEKQSITKNQIVITFFSPTGYDYAIKREFAECVTFLPLEQKREILKFYAHFHPKVAIFVRYELWFSVIFEGLKRNIDFFLINARFSKNHFVTKIWGKPYKNLLLKFNHIFTSDENSIKILDSIGVKNLTFNGDTRYDRVYQIVKKATPFPIIQEFKKDDKLLILGSSYTEEEKILGHLLDSSVEIKIVIAPHHINDERIDEIKNRFQNFDIQTYTEFDHSKPCQILILNTMGMLSSVYQYADFALIGGGFSGALHNIIEPAFWGCALSFGPKFNKFPEAQDMISNKLAHPITYSKEWIDWIEKLLNNEEEINYTKNVLKKFCKKNLGATEKIISHLPIQ